MPQKPGHYKQATLATLNGGKALRLFEDRFAHALVAYEEHETETGSTKDKVKLTMTIEVTRSKTNESCLDLTYDAKVAVPKRKQAASHHFVSGRLLTPLDGSDDINDSQQPLLAALPTFDRFGQRQASINPQTGEVVENDTHTDDDAVVEKIG